MHPHHIRNAIALLALMLLTLHAAADFSPRRLSFSLRLGELNNVYDTMSVFLLPGEAWQLAARGLDAGEALELTDSRGQRHRGHHWQLAAPAQPGHYRLTLRRASRDETATLHLFVLHPTASVREGRLNGYRIGHYPGEPLRGQAIYLPPRGFVEVTADNADTWVSPHYRLRQFVSKQAGDYPKYLVLRTRLLLKLEYLTEQAVAAGLASGPFHIMSGFRTPHYNRAIGNRRYSRHQWGGAADIFIDDRPRDGMMDDLDGNGRIDRDDARVLQQFIERLSRRDEYRPYVGGLGLYGSTAAHGPFVHVDVRGQRARW